MPIKTKPSGISLIVLAVWCTTALSPLTASARRCLTFDVGNIPLTAGEIISPESGNVIFDSVFMRSRLGQIVGKAPANYADVMLRGRDLPASMIDVRARRSARFWNEIDSWSQPQSKFAELGRRLELLGVPWLDYGILNREAGKIWQRMLACNENDAEVVRRQYFLAEPCEKNHEESEALKIEIGNLASNLHLLLASSQLIDATDLSGLVLSKTVKDTSLRIPDQHPLLVQLALQEWSLLYNHFAEKKMPVTQSLVYSLDQLKGIPRPSWSALSPPNDTQLAWGKISLNLMAIISSVSEPSIDEAHSCSTYGLWPVMNRALLFPRHNSYNDLVRTINGGQTLRDEIELMERRATHACGERLDIANGSGSVFGFYSKTGVTHIMEMRRLFAAYWPVKVASEDLAMMAKEAQVELNGKGNTCD